MLESEIDLTVEIDENGINSHITVLTLFGNIHQEESEKLEDDIIKSLGEGKKCFVLDLTNVTTICSAALGMLASYQKSFSSSKKGFHLVVNNPQLLEILKVTMLHQIFSIYEIKEDAIRAFSYN